MNINEKIIYLREKHNMSQIKLAKLMNIDKSVMNRIELGTRPVRDNELLQLSKIFNVTTDYLLGKTNKKYSEDTNKDIAIKIEELINETKDKNSEFYNEKLTDKARESLADALEVVLKLHEKKIKKDE